MATVSTLLSTHSLHAVHASLHAHAHCMASVAHAPATSSATNTASESLGGNGPPSVRQRTPESAPVPDAQPQAKRACVGGSHTASTPVSQDPVRGQAERRTASPSASLCAKAAPESNAAPPESTGNVLTLPSLRSFPEDALGASCQTFWLPNANRESTAGGAASDGTTRIEVATQSNAGAAFPSAGPPPAEGAAAVQLGEPAAAARASHVDISHILSMVPSHVLSQEVKANVASWFQQGGASSLHEVLDSVAAHTSPSPPLDTPTTTAPPLAHIATSQDRQDLSHTLSSPSSSAAPAQHASQAGDSSSQPTARRSPQPVSMALSQAASARASVPSSGHGIELHGQRFHGVGAGEEAPPQHSAGPAALQWPQASRCTPTDPTPLSSAAPAPKEAASAAVPLTPERPQTSRMTMRSLSVPGCSRKPAPPRVVPVSATNPLTPAERSIFLEAILPVAVQLAVFADGGLPGRWCESLGDIHSVGMRVVLKVAARHVAAGWRAATLRVLLLQQARM